MHGPTSADETGRVGHLVDRHPSVSPERLIAQLTPPPTFAEVSFATYHPDPAEPTQAAAVEACQRFCRQAVERRAGARSCSAGGRCCPASGSISTVASASAKPICSPSPTASWPKRQTGTARRTRRSWN